MKAGGVVPADVGGRIRSYNILLELAKRHAITLYTFYAAQDNDPHADLSRVFEKVLYRPLALPRPHGLGETAKFVRTFFSALPYSVSKYCALQIARELRELVETEQYDVMVCDFVIAGGVIPWEHPCPTILFTHNVEAQIWQRHYRVTSNPLWKAIAWSEYHKMKAFERKCLRMSDHILTVSEPDRHCFASIVQPEKLSTLPTGVDTSFFRPGSLAEERPDSIVFTGAMDWLPNEDGIIYFLRSVFPLIQRASPGISFTVVGRRPSQSLQRIALKCGISVSGRVEDVRPYVRKASLYVVPLRIGSGTRLKIFEAMAMGKAIVSTTVGAEGLPVNHGRDIILADTPEEFASAVSRLLRDGQTRHAMGVAARELVERNFSWQVVAGVFDNAIRTCLSNRATQNTNAKGRVDNAQEHSAIHH